MTETTESPAVSKADLDILVAACTSHLPPDASPEVTGAFGRILAAWDDAAGPDGLIAIPAEAPPAAPDGEGQWQVICFFGHAEYTGWVTEISKHGQPAYRIDLPEKIWGGNPLAYVTHAASSWFSDHPVTEESVRAAWEARQERARLRAEQEAEWERAQQQRALEAGDGDDEPRF